MFDTIPTPTEAAAIWADERPSDPLRRRVRLCLHEHAHVIWLASEEFGTAEVQAEVEAEGIKVDAFIKGGHARTGTVFQWSFTYPPHYPTAPMDDRSRLRRSVVFGILDGNRLPFYTTAPMPDRNAVRAELVAAGWIVRESLIQTPRSDGPSSSWIVEPSR